MAETNQSENNQSETKSTIIIDTKDDRQFWKEEEEKILEEWADKAQCFEWMHHKTHDIYKKKNGYYTIPVIIISTITGTANFAQERIPADYISMYVMIIGSMNIFAGILTTIYQYLKISELNESNRVAYLSWGKFFRDVKTELLKHPLDRMRPKELLKLSKNEYDRLVEISPPIPQKIINEFNSKMKAETTDGLRKPEMCDKMTATRSFELSTIEREELRNIISNRETNVDTIKPIDPRVENFKKTFFEMNNREPTEDELNTMFFSVYNTNKSVSNSSVTAV
jgi:hypothetical protein